MAHIMIVEDDESICRELLLLLGSNGHTTSACTDFNAVVEDIVSAQPELVLLDLTLPQTDGLAVCRELRRVSKVPLIVVTSRTSELDEVMAMSLGADDYLTKPYRPRVLLAHIEAMLRRASEDEGASTREHGGLSVDIARSAATNLTTGASTSLTKNELRILSYLMENAGQPCARTDIMRYLWDSDSFIDDNTLTVNVNRLRSTLTKIGMRGYLHTHRGLGYSV